MSKKIAVTLGEPAGIGIELVAKLALKNQLSDCIIVGDENLLKEYINLHHLPISVNTPCDDKIFMECHHIPIKDTVKYGKLNIKNANYVLDILNHSVHNCLDGQYAAMVTCPLHKGVINDAGIAFTGHTEYLAQLSQTPKVVMMLLNQAMRVALASTHLPLKNVHTQINKKNLSMTLDVLIHDLTEKFSIESPRIAVCGLNPHAGEDGHLGDEEIKIINPLIKEYQSQGHDIQGSFPADTLFTPAKLKGFDAVLAMYHDQGLAPLKYAGFGKSVNITLGLPFIRTSVDHGTALDIAGKNIASADSLEEAIKLTRELIHA